MAGRAWTAAGLAVLAGVASAAQAQAAPVAHDFERPLAGVESVAGAGAKSADGRVSYRSDVVQTGASFDAVGLAGEMRPLEIRAREAGEPWTDWNEISGGDPLYVVSGADRAQLRTRGWRPSGRLHFVSVSGTTAKAETPKPQFVNRSGWGAGGCPPRVSPAYGRVKAVAVHHTVSSNDYSAAQAPGIVLAICRYHRNGNGWNDIGYNALVDRFGTLYEGRAGGLRKPVIGAHAEGYNAQSAGISVIGNHVDVGASAKARQSIARYIAWKLDAIGKEAEGHATLVSGGGETNRYAAGRRVRLPRVFGHGTVGITACPGAALARQLSAIRARAQRIQDAHAEAAQGAR